MGAMVPKVQAFRWRETLPTRPSWQTLYLSMNQKHCAWPRLQTPFTWLSEAAGTVAPPSICPQARLVSKAGHPDGSSR